MRERRDHTSPEAKAAARAARKKLHDETFPFEKEFQRVEKDVQSICHRDDINIASRAFHLRLLAGEIMRDYNELLLDMNVFELADLAAKR
ncbi:MAG: hypothetical protein ACR2OE_15035 [Thermomicrobiales bacterium]